MRITVVYDSQFGNTEKIARQITKTLQGMRHKVNLVHAKDATEADTLKTDMLIVGCPTQGGRPTLKMQQYLVQIPDEIMANVRVAVFDTRYMKREQSFALKLLMDVIGFAAEKMMETLIKKGARPVSEPMGFIVETKDGPIRKGELERASRWVRSLV